MPAPNVAITDSIWLFDYAVPPSPITGKVQGDFTISDPRLAKSATTATLVLTEAETQGGEYEIEWTPTAVGNWSGYISYNQNGVQRSWALSERVEAAQPTSGQIAAAVVAQSVIGSATGTLGGKVASIGSLAVTTGPVDPMSADRTVVQGDAYEGDDALSWADNAWSIPADATITLSATYAGQTVTFAGTRISATVVSIDLSALHTAALVPGRAHYRYRITANDDILVVGAMSVTLG